MAEVDWEELAQAEESGQQEVDWESQLQTQEGTRWLRDEVARVMKQPKPQTDYIAREAKRRFPVLNVDQQSVDDMVMDYRDADLIVGGGGIGEEEGVAKFVHPARRESVVAAVQDLASQRKTRQKRGFFAKTGELALRQTSGMLKPAVNLMTAAVGFGLDDEQELFRRDLEAAYNSGDPLVPESDPWYKRFASQGFAMAGPMILAQTAGGALGGLARAGSMAQKALSAVGVGGAFGPAMYEDTYYSLRKEGIPETTARVMAGISAVLQGAAETFELNPILGREVKDVILRSARQKLLGFGKRFAKEWSEEFIQGATDEVAKETARWLEGKTGRKGYYEALKAGAAQGLATGGPLLFMMGGPAVVKQLASLPSSPSRAQFEQAGGPPGSSIKTREETVKQAQELVSKAQGAVDAVIDTSAAPSDAGGGPRVEAGQVQGTVEEGGPGVPVGGQVAGEVPGQATKEEAVGQPTPGPAPAWVTPISRREIDFLEQQGIRDAVKWQEIRDKARAAGIEDITTGAAADIIRPYLPTKPEPAPVSADWPQYASEPTVDQEGLPANGFRIRWPNGEEHIVYGQHNVRPFIEARRKNGPPKTVDEVFAEAGAEVKGKPGQAPPAVTPPTMTFEEFRKQYTSLFNQMMKYGPNEVGGDIFAEKMAKLSDEHPDWAKKVEDEAETAKATPAPATPQADNLESLSPAEVEKEWRRVKRTAEIAPSKSEPPAGVTPPVQEGDLPPLSLENDIDAKRKWLTSHGWRKVGPKEDQSKLVFRKGISVGSETWILPTPGTTPARLMPPGFEIAVRRYEAAYAVADDATKRSLEHWKGKIQTALELGGNATENVLRVWGRPEDLHPLRKKKPQPAPPLSPEQAQQLKDANITLKRTASGWVASGIPEEHISGLTTDYSGRKLGKGGYFFRKDPTAGLLDAARTVAAEAERHAAAKARGMVVTRIGELTPEAAEAYEQVREERIALATDAVRQRNSNVEEMLGQFVKKQRRGQFALEVRYAAEKHDADKVPGFDKMVEYAKDHPGLGLPGNETDLFDLLTRYVLSLDEKAIAQQVDNELAAELLQIGEERGDAWEGDEGEASFDPSEFAEGPPVQQAAIPGLETEAARAARREVTPPKFESVGGKQEALFGKAGLPGQMNLFADKGVPDDLLSAEQRALAAAEAAKPQVNAFGAGPGGGTMTLPRDLPDLVSIGVDPPAEEIMRRRDKAHGVKPQPWSEWAKDLFWTGWFKATRHFEFIPKIKNFAVAYYAFRHLQDVGNTQQSRSAEVIAAVVDPMGPKQLWIFEELLNARNMLAALDAGQGFRFGWEVSGRDGLQKYVSQLEAAAAKIPEIAQALQMRQAVAKELVDILVQEKLMPAGTTPDNYVHQQVLMYAEAKQRAARGGRVPRPIRRPMQRERIEGVEAWGEEYDWNTSWIESEMTWMTDARIELEKKRLSELLEREYDQLPGLKDRAKNENWVNFVGGQANANRIEQLRGMIAESNASEDAQDSGERMQRKIWIEELQELDPTYPHRIKIAMFMDMLREELGIQQDPDYDDEDDLTWAMIQEAADKGSVAALGVFKWNNMRRDLIQKELGSKFKTWKDYVRNDPTVMTHQWKPGNVMYPTVTIPQKIASQLQQHIIDVAEIREEDLSTVLALGGKQKQYVFPVEIVQQLQKLDEIRPSNIWTKLADEMMRDWKIWTLLWPKHALAYYLRNFTGDLDPVIAAAPNILRAEYLGRSIRELKGYYSGKKLITNRNLQDAIDNGTISAGMTATEIADIKELPVFTRFLQDKPGVTEIPKQVIKDYFSWVKQKNEAREAVLRYAAYLYYKDQLQKGTLEHYGVSKKEVVDTLRRKVGIEAAAGMLSRELLGDYGARTVMGQFLSRKIIPFFSFQEINLQRYPSLLREAIRVGNYRQARGAGVLAGKALTVALTMRLGAMYAAMWVWNNLFKPDEEDDATPYDRANPHINLGRNADGSLRKFRNVGALGDVLEWGGLNDLPTLLRMYEAGQISGATIAKEMGKSFVNKIVGGTAPWVKSPWEIGTGTSLFPDVLNPRSAERGELAAGMAGLQDEYRWAKGMIVGKGNRARPYYWQRAVLGVSDPRANALSEMYDLKARFLAKKGVSEEGILPISKYRNARYAAQNEDYDAFLEWKQAFVAEHGDTPETGKKFFSFLDSIDPIKTMRDEYEVEFEKTYLNDVQRKKLQMTRDYAQSLRDLLVNWWVASGGKAPDHSRTRKSVRKVPRLVS